MVWSCPSNCTQYTLLNRVPSLPQLLEHALQAPTCQTFCMQGAVAAVRLVTAEEQLVAVVAVPALVRQAPASSSNRLWPQLCACLISGCCLAKSGPNLTRQVLAHGSRAAFLLECRGMHARQKPLRRAWRSRIDHPSNLRVQNQLVRNLWPEHSTAALCGLRKFCLKAAALCGPASCLMICYRLKSPST